MYVYIYIYNITLNYSSSDPCVFLQSLDRLLLPAWRLLACEKKRHEQNKHDTVGKACSFRVSLSIAVTVPPPRLMTTI